jgi:histidyl-tRNA synthetase
MTLSKKPYKGCRDLFPEDKKLQQTLFDAMRKSSELFAFEPYDGPMLETVELYLAKSGQELINDQIYSFKDRGDRTVAIRPEMTPTLARMVAQVVKEVPKPIRWYSIPNLMRYERPQRGRLREHWQWNVDIFGSTPGMGEVEVLSLLTHFLSQFGATHEHFEIRVNDREIINTVMAKLLKLNQDQSYLLIKLIDRSEKISPEQFQKDLHEIISEKSLQSIFQDYLKLNSFEQLKDFLLNHNIQLDQYDLFQFYEIASSTQLKNYIQFIPTIVRGLDYYTGIVFEVFDKNPENRRALCGGGSYHQLLTIFKEQEIPAVGFGLGDVTLKDFLETHQLLPKISKAPAEVLITYQASHQLGSCLELAENMRAQGISCELSTQMMKYKKIFNYAEKKEFPFLIVIGDDEISQKQFKIKNLSNRNEESFSFQFNKKNMLKFLRESHDNS